MYRDVPQDPATHLTTTTTTMDITMDILTSVMLTIMTTVMDMEVPMDTNMLISKCIICFLKHVVCNYFISLIASHAIIQ